MFTVSTIHWVTGVVFIGQFATESILCSAFQDDTTVLLIPSNIQLINFLISDSIVSWRAWVIWERRKWILAVFGCFIFINSGASVVNLISDIDAEHLPQLLSADFGLLVLAVSALNNLWATSLTAYKIWQRRRDFELHELRHSFLGLKALVLLTESGIIYTFIWLFFLAAEFDLLGSQLFGVCVQKSIVQITAIYPTLIILLIFLERTTETMPQFERKNLPV
ncbi:hypothetical protein K488DRAFT_86369 [Vararia minispora EC-137]|uniref:Uncharacterized protein n=1 Tax=Vararia minispora EC-137 TaxID=1314806 RepID=A0ACB8QJW8_9AGAM|nr:hypothetical protein K488DRAFT_86369 [Vararia minispora EC-137]